MFTFQRKNTSGWLFSDLLLFLGAFAWILWSIYFALVTIFIPYQIEYREGTAQVITGFLLSGTNPFVLENQPLAMNNYGISYNLLVLPFAILFGNTLVVHRSVTFVFVLLSALAACLVVYQRKENIASAAGCTAFILIGLIGRGGIGAFPPAMGTFLFLMTLLVPFCKGFNTTSLVLSVLFSITAFYAKPYFVLGFGILASYLFLFQSKKIGLLYLVLFLMLFSISLVVVRLAFPLYFVNTIIGNISNVESSSAHLLSQLKQLLIYFFPVLLSSLFLFLIEKGKSRRSPGFEFHVKDWKEPLMSSSPDYLLYSSLCALLAFLLVLGPHIGNYLNYAYQLVLPLFFCWFFLSFDPSRKWRFLLAAAVIFNLFFWGTNVLSPSLLESRTSKEWDRLYSYIRSSSNILNSPVITSGVIRFGLTPLDSGQTSYFYFVKPYPDSPLFGPPYNDFHADGAKYIKFIDNSIEKQKFDLVVTTVEKSTFYHSKLLEEFYAPVDTLTVDMPHTDQQWTLLIWKPLAQ